MKTTVPFGAQTTRLAHFSKFAIAGILTCFATISNAQNPTSPALGFNIFVRNNAQFKTNETEGAVAIGDQMTLAGDHQIGTKNTGTFKVDGLTIGLLVGGKIVYSASSVTLIKNSYVKVGNSAGSTAWYIDNNGSKSNLRVTSGSYDSKPFIELEKSAKALDVSATKNPVMQSGLIDFASAFTNLQNNSKNMSAYATNIELTDPNGTKKGTTIASVVTNGQLKVNLKSGTNVLHATGAELNSVTSSITFNTKPSADRPLVINVNAPGSFNWSVWNQSGLALTNSPYIIYNFYNTTSLQIAGSNYISGTVFAPFANITKTANPSNIEGQIIGLSYMHAGGKNMFALFQATLPNTNVPAVSKPATAATGLTFTNLSTTSCKLTWNNGSGAGRLVIAQKGSEPAAPTDNVFYTANPKIGTGTTIGAGSVVYNGQGNSVTVTNLQKNSQYFFSVVEYNSAGTAISYSTTTPSQAQRVTTVADADDDGVPDAEDMYPNDAAKAFATFYPASGFGTLLYEDQWPFKGDYDFNDLVVDYRFTTITNSSNNVVQIDYAFVPKASGANYKNGFAFQLDGISADKIASVSGTRMANGWTTLNSNGTEAGQPVANVIVFDNANAVFTNAPAAGIINVVAASQKFNSDTIRITVRFANGMTLASLPASLFNPYLIVNQIRGNEVHLPNRLPSAKIDKSLFGKGDDKSNPGAGKYFKSATNLPWALNIVGSIPYPQEKLDITKAYLNFIKWASSNGSSNTDWYLDKPGGRDASKLYLK